MIPILKVWEKGNDGIMQFFTSDIPHITPDDDFNEVGGRKYFTLYQGKEWDGEIV